MFQMVGTPEEGEAVVIVDRYGTPFAAIYENGRYVAHYFNGRPVYYGADLVRSVWRWAGEREAVLLNQMKPEDYGEAPAVAGDIPAYWSPLSFKMVEGRKARREEMRKHNVIEVGSEMPKLPN